MKDRRPLRSPESLRSHRWLGVQDLRAFGHRSRLQQMGYDRADFAGKPVIAIINTWSDINQCHAHLRTRAEEVKRGIWQAGGFPLELPAMSLSEPFVKPTTMLYRNFLAMEVEELLRSHPIDGAILLGGCDKTTPGLLMGAISMGLPCLFVPAGPMLRGNWRGQVLGSGSDAWKYWDELRAGNISEADWEEIEGGIARSFGTCMTMGTAASMMAVAEALGFTLPNASSIPAADANHPRMATASGRRIVEMVWQDVTPDQIISREAVQNAMVVHNAMGGSTNVIIHLIAIARRAGISLDLADFDALSRTVPVLANVRPSGQYLMEDFWYAGGLRALMSRLRPHLDLSLRTVADKRWEEILQGAEVHNNDVIRDNDNPVFAEGATAVLTGNLAPNGAVMKPAAARADLLSHRGPALVFPDYDAMAKAVEDEGLEVTPDHVLILQNAGPQGGPGMPEWGMLPIPRKLVRQGVRDMLRISDARMSGTSYGACILHVAPEAWVGGPLALVRNGDEIEVDVSQRSLNLRIDAREMERRREAWNPPAPRYQRGWGALFQQHIGQADQGCDFDFLQAGAPTPEPEIH
ncbi:L-arabinonate dehydratase [Aquibaculum sediminis]|uniref:L-arabinonate dehydratase n=1 Tax=Aquibaculum sediminis TaxID=3231907 RepID=UPI00345434AF